MPVHTEKERAKRKVKRSNQAAVSDATKVAVKPERNKKIKPEIRQAPVNGSKVLKGVAKHILGPIAQGLLVKPGIGPLSKVTKNILNQITANKLTIRSILKMRPQLKDIEDAAARVAKIRKRIKKTAGVSAAEKDKLAKSARTIASAQRGQREINHGNFKLNDQGYLE